MTGLDILFHFNLSVADFFICNTYVEVFFKENLILYVYYFSVVGTSDSGVWEGRINGHEGYFHHSHVQEVRLRKG